MVPTSAQRLHRPDHPEQDALLVNEFHPYRDGVSLTGWFVNRTETEPGSDLNLAWVGLWDARQEAAKTAAEYLLHCFPLEPVTFLEESRATETPQGKGFVRRIFSQKRTNDTPPEHTDGVNTSLRMTRQEYEDVKDGLGDLAQTAKEREACAFTCYNDIASSNGSNPLYSFGLRDDIDAPELAVQAVSYACKSSFTFRKNIVGDDDVTQIPKTPFMPADVGRYLMIISEYTDNK